jgi:Ca2+/H+ antiporter
MIALVTFAAGAVVSLLTSWQLVSRLEWSGERLGLSEALLGIVAALAADAPEITAAAAARACHQQRVGAGVVLGSKSSISQPCWAVPGWPGGSACTARWWLSAGWLPYRLRWPACWSSAAR